MDLILGVKERIRLKQTFFKEDVWVDVAQQDDHIESKFYGMPGWVLCIYKVGNSIYNLTFPSAEYYEDWIESADSDSCKEGELIYTNYKN